MRNSNKLALFVLITGIAVSPHANAVDKEAAARNHESTEHRSPSSMQALTAKHSAVLRLHLLFSVTSGQEQ